MNSLLKILLYVTGYNYRVNSNNAPLEIRQSKGNMYHTRNPVHLESNRNAYIGHAYNLLITMLIVWRVPYTLIVSIREHDSTIIGRSVFQILLTVQYVQGIRYFRRNHFYRNIVTNTDLMKLFLKCIPLTVLISFGASIAMTIALNNNISIHGYSKLYDGSKVTGKVCLSILLFIDSLYSYQTFTINACVFVVNMIYHKRRVSEYSHNLSNSFIQSDVDIEKKLTAVSNEYLRMKELYNGTVNVLSPFFASLNFFGFISAYYTLIALNNNDITLDEICNIILFLLILVCYIATIHVVNSSISGISSAIRSSAMTTVNFTGDSGAYNDHLTNISPYASSHNLNVKAKRSKNNTNHIDDGSGVGPAILEDIKRIDSIHDPLSEYSYSIEEDIMIRMNKMERILNGLIMSNNDCLSLNKKIVAITNGCEREIKLILSRFITEEKWDSFSLFGVDITDTKLISRIFGIIISVLITSEVIDQTNWWS